MCVHAHTSIYEIMIYSFLFVEAVYYNIDFSCHKLNITYTSVCCPKYIQSTIQGMYSLVPRVCAIHSSTQGKYCILDYSVYALYSHLPKICIVLSTTQSLQSTIDYSRSLLYSRLPNVVYGTLVYPEYVLYSHLPKDVLYFLLLRVVLYFRTEIYSFKSYKEYFKEFFPNIFSIFFF